MAKASFSCSPGVLGYAERKRDCLVKSSENQGGKLQRKTWWLVKCDQFASRTQIHIHNYAYSYMASKILIHI
jgi:hypothetical protein